MEHADPGTREAAQVLAQEASRAAAAAVARIARHLGAGLTAGPALPRVHLAAPPDHHRTGQRRQRPVRRRCSRRVIDGGGIHGHGYGTSAHGRSCGHCRRLGSAFVAQKRHLKFQG